MTTFMAVSAAERDLDGGFGLLEREHVGDEPVEGQVLVVLGEHRQGAVIDPGVLAGDADDRQVPAQDGCRVDRHRTEIDERADLDEGAAVAQQS